MPDNIEELLRRVEADDPVALWEYSRILEETDKDEAYKYLVLAAQLFHPQAAMLLGDRYAEKSPEDAERYYRMGAKAGLTDCSVKLAVLHLSSGEPRALVELEELAEMGVSSACKALADYYKSHGNENQYSYWSSRAQQ